MSISESDKHNIMEDEAIRFEVRRRLISENHGCGMHGHGHCCRSLWGWIVAGILALMLAGSYCHNRFYCPMGMGPQSHYQAGQPAQEEAPAPAAEPRAKK